MARNGALPREPTSLMSINRMLARQRQPKWDKCVGIRKCTECGNVTTCWLEGGEVLCTEHAARAKLKSSGRGR